MFEIGWTILQCINKLSELSVLDGRTYVDRPKIYKSFNLKDFKNSYVDKDNFYLFKTSIIV